MFRICIRLSILASAVAPVAALPANDLLAIHEPQPLALSITPDAGVSLHAGEHRTLRGCRAFLVSRPAGGESWNEEHSNYQVVSRDGDTLTLEAAFSVAKARITISRDADGRCRLGGTLESTADRPVELARFHYLDGTVSDSSLNLLSMRQFELPGRIVKPSEKLRSPRAACEKGWGGVHWPRLSEPVHDAPDTAISGDSGMLAADWNSPGFFLGFTGPGDAFGEIGIRTMQTPTPFFLAVLLDGVRLDPGQSRKLENAVISFGDPQDELRHWAMACRDALGPARVRPPLVGYCSWYQKGQGVKPADIRRALDSFGPYDAPPGGRTIQIDDGYQVCPGDWTGRGEWATELDKLPAEIKAKGFIPGIWIAPTAIHESHPIAKQHPDWLQRDASGAPCITFHNWKNFNGMTAGKTYFLEPDHPEARKFILKTLRDLRAKGWDYFKIDFAYTVSSARVKHDPSKTTCESLRDQWKLFREALGDDAIINSCNGGIWRYTLGIVDISRIGGDIGGNMKTLRRNLAEMMLRSHVNGLWFQADPDVFYMRSENSALNFEQSHLLTATQGLSGTAFLTSDFADQWSPAAANVVKRYWNKNGPRVPTMQRLMLRPDGLPAAMAAAYGNGEYALGIYNWDTTSADVAVSLTDLGLPANRTYTPGNPATDRILMENGTVRSISQPEESLRVLTLRALPSP